MADKAFKTYTEQRKILENRGLIISHPRSFRDIMLREGYYNIINGYKKHFLTTTSPDQYIAQTTFEQLYALYLFDQELRTLFMSALIKIEKHIKALLAYHFSEKYGNDDNVYMNLNNFNCDTIRNERRAEALIRIFNQDLRYYEQHGNNAICHYRVYHTFGDYSTMNLRRCFIMPSKRKDGRYQSSVILENPITGEKVRRYFYAYTLQELEAERRRIMNTNISDFLLVETFHHFADEFLTSPYHFISPCIDMCIIWSGCRRVSPRKQSSVKRNTADKFQDVKKAVKNKKQKKKASKTKCSEALNLLAERVGFEPTVHCCTLDFEFIFPRFFKVSIYGNS